jgi:uncharacterized protein (TIGR01777 family)
MNRLVLAGGSGFLGTAISKYFAGTADEIVVLTRRPTGQRGVREVCWDGATLGPWQQELNGARAVINLCGRSVNCRYNRRNRQLILDSRINSTRVLGQAIAQCKQPPQVWLNAGTATIYRHSFDQAMDEASGTFGAAIEAKDEFSLEVAIAWERALELCRLPQTRKVALRTAMVLGPGKNSVFPVLRRLVRFGLGGKMGNGRQFVSWIHQDDLCRAIGWLMQKNDFEGPVNLVAPNPLPNAQMMSTLCRVCRAPFGLPANYWMLEVGAWLLRTETELILKSRRVVPGKLLASGFQFNFADFESAAIDIERQIMEAGRLG